MMNRTVTIKRVAATVFVLCSATVTSAITPGQAEEPGFLTRIGLDFGLAKREETPETRLSGELSTCLRLAVGKAEGPSVGFTIDLDGDGKVLGAPVLEVSSTTPERSQIQLDRAAIAIENCLPLQLGTETLRQTRLTLVLDRGQIAYLEREPLFEAPAPLAPELAEIALDLGKEDRRDVQNRLTVAGFDPGKPDGVIGPKTRKAISDWQIAHDFAQTGYLDETQLTFMREATQEKLDKAVARKKSTTKRRLSKYIRTADGCVRVRKTNRIVPHQSFKCDVKGLAESF